MNAAARYAKSLLRGRRERRERAPAANVIVSFPKSGRTWLRLLVGKALAERHGFAESDMLDTFELTRRAGLPPAVFSHDGASNTEARHLRRLSPGKSDYAKKRVLLLRRDPRDVVVSCYFQASKRRDLFTGSLSEFVRHPCYGIDKILRWYRIWEDNVDVPASFELLSYESLHTDTAGALARTLTFLGETSVDAETIDRAVEYARFDNMRKLELGRKFDNSRMLPGKSGDEDSLKVRRGKVGGYRDYLDAGDLAYCDEAMVREPSNLLSVDEAEFNRERSGRDRNAGDRRASTAP